MVILIHWIIIRCNLINTFISIYTYIRIYQSICMSIYLPIYLSTYPAIYPSIYLSMYLSVYLSIFFILRSQIYLNYFRQSSGRSADIDQFSQLVRSGRMRSWIEIFQKYSVNISYENLSDISQKKLSIVNMELDEMRNYINELNI